MTSKRFSNKASSKFDFKDSFKSFIVPALVLIIAMAYNISAVVSYIKESNADLTKGINFFGARIQKGYIQCFFNNDDYGPMLILFLCFAGFLFALASFAPFLNKRSSNFYFSAPVTRSDLFKNRILSSLVTMSGILFVAVVIITIMNLVASVTPLFVIQWALAYYFECLIYMLASYAIFSFALVLSYTFVEGIIFGASIYLLPTGVAFAFDLFYDVFLKTYNREPFTNEFMYSFYNAFNNISLLKELSLFNPVLLGADISNHELYNTIIEQANSEGNVVSTLPSIYQIIPLIVWAVIISAFIFVAKKAFLNRKVENTGLHASNKLVNIYIATGFGVGVSAICASCFEDNRAASLVCAIVGFVVSFAVFYSVSIRKIKHSKKAFAYLGSVTAVLAVFLSVLCLGGFGYDSYVPNANDVEMVSLTGNISANGSIQYYNNGSDALPIKGGYATTGIGVFTEEEDIKKVVELAKTFNKTTDNMIRSNTYIVYQLKNGKRVYRSFPKLDSDVKKSIITLTDTKEYKDTQRYIFTGEGESNFDKNLTKYGFDGSEFFDSSLTYTDAFEYMGNNYSSSFLYNAVKSANAVVGAAGSDEIKIENTDALRKALAEDYYNATSDEIYFTKQKAVCYIGFVNKENDGEEDAFMIYPNMKNTISYLNSIGVLDKVKEFQNVQSFEGVYLVNYGKEIKNPYTLDERVDDIFTGGEMLYSDIYNGEEVDDEYRIETIYGSGKYIEDKDQIQQIIKNATPLKYVTADDTIVLLKVKTEKETLYIPLVMLND